MRRRSERDVTSPSSSARAPRCVGAASSSALGSKQEEEEEGEEGEEKAFVGQPIPGKGAYLISVGNLSTSTTTQDTKAAFELFGPCFCSMLTRHHGKSTRFAVLGFRQLAQAANALRKMRHAKIDKHCIKVRAGGDGVETAAFRRKNNLVSDGGDARWAYQVFVENLAWGVTSRMLFDTIEEHLHFHSTVQAARVLQHRKGHYWRGCPMGAGWIVISSKADAKSVMSFLRLHEVKIMGRPMRAGREKIECLLLTNAY